MFCDSRWWTWPKKLARIEQLPLVNNKLIHSSTIILVYKLLEMLETLLVGIDYPAKMKTQEGHNIWSYTKSPAECFLEVPGP